MSKNSETILIVDDEKEIADLLEVYLKNENYQVRKFYRPKEALECVEHEPISLAILDIMMPEMDGFVLCNKIRQKYLFPIIMLTAKGEDIDKIQGLTLGADDYITKPFNPLEVVARVKTQLRRYKQYNTNGYTSALKAPVRCFGNHLSGKRKSWFRTDNECGGAAILKNRTSRMGTPVGC